VSTIYVTGHRNPDADSIASAIGYAELRRRLHPNDDYVPVRLGECNAQTRWLLEKSGAPEPVFLPHVMLRVCDVMHTSFPVSREDESIREAGLAMVRADLELVPVVDRDGALVGLVTERALARRYVRESRHTSTLEDAPASVRAIAGALDGEVLVDGSEQLAGRVWVQAMEVGSPTGISEGDVVVVGNREDAQRLAIDRGAALLVTSNGAEPSAEVLAIARERSTAVISSPLDSYVSGRMITLAAPCKAFAEGDPLTVTTEYLVADASEQIKDVHYGAAVVVDSRRRPVGLVRRSDLVSPPRRRVLLVDHAEQAQSVTGVEDAEIVEILDHHHIGSIETRVPVTATFDPVGSTATLVIERFRQNGMEPSRSTAMMLLGALMSDTVILNSPTTTQRDHAVVDYLERVLALDATAFGGEMFEETLRLLRGQRRGDRFPRRQAVPGAERQRDLHRPDRGGRARSARAQARVARGDAAGPRHPRRPHVRADGHRRAREGHRPAGRGRRGAGGAEPRDHGGRQRDRASGRDEPQEAGRTEAAGEPVGRPAEDRPTDRAQPEAAPTAWAGASPQSCSSR
jgi:manganese-dependent inorganic pyrophosphatase